MECFNKACVLNINNCCGLKDVYISESGVCGKILVLEADELDVLERKYSLYKEAEKVLPKKKEDTKVSNADDEYNFPLDITKETLYQMYIKEGKPSRLIAELMGVNESRIKSLIRKWGLTRNEVASGEKEEIIPNPTKRYR